MKLIKRNPWLWIVFAFVILIAAWTVLITIALKNQPEKVPVEEAQEPAAPADQENPSGN